MTIKAKIYVNHCYEEVITEAEYLAKVEENAKDIREDKDIFAEWLDDEFDEIDIWNMTAGDRAKTEADWLTESKRRAENSLSEEGWQEYELEL